MRCTLLCCLLATPLFCHAAQGGRESVHRGPSPPPIELLSYTLRSQQSELRMLQERVGDYEAQADLLRNDVKRALSEQDTATAQLLQKLTLRLQESEQENAQLRHDLILVTDNLKELHTLVQSLQTTLQQQVKKGQILEKTLSTLVSSLSPTQLASEGAEHKVQAGETLEKIARKYGTSIRLLKEENQLDTDRIRVGQLLKIPPTPSPSPP